jgi:hypothetical protein
MRATRNRSVTDGKVRVRMTTWRGTATRTRAAAGGDTAAAVASKR